MLLKGRRCPSQVLIKSTVLRDLDLQTFHNRQHASRVFMQHIIAL
jgi:hypothetical protein